MKKCVFTLFLFLFTKLLFADSVGIANNVLNEAILNSDFNKSYIYNGCYVRAHFLSYELFKKKVESFKIFIHTQSSERRIIFKSPIKGKKDARWIYHVVTAIKENNNYYVLDPLISNTVIEISNWVQKLKNNQKDLQLNYQILPSSEYIPDIEENAEFKKYGHHFGLGAMDYVRDAMNMLYVYEDL